MIVGDELGAWTRDPERQARARRAALDHGEAWGRGPVHVAFTRAFASVPHDAAKVAEAAETLFADDHWIDHLVRGLAQQMRDDPYFEPPFRHINSDIHKGLVVYEDDKVSIAVGVTGAAQLAAKKQAPRAGTSVALTGQVSVMKFVKAGNARLSFWSAPATADQFRAAEAGTCRRVREARIADGDMIRIDGRREGFVIEAASANILLVQAVAKAGQAPLAVEYDSVTGRFVGCSAADDSASRIQMITTLVRKMGHERAFPAIAAFLDHPHFFLRWHVMRELLGLDAMAALPHLERMARSDPHAENRLAAQAVLARLGNADRAAA